MHIKIRPQGKHLLATELRHMDLPKGILPHIVSEKDVYFPAKQHDKRTAAAVIEPLSCSMSFSRKSKSSFHPFTCSYTGLYHLRNRAASAIARITIEILSERPKSGDLGLD